MEGQPCTFPGCVNTQKAHKLCPAHNAQFVAGKELKPLRVYNKQDPALAEVGLRKCSVCAVIKSIDEFYVKEWLCKECSSIKTLQYKKDHPIYNRQQARVYQDRYPAKVKRQKLASDQKNHAQRRAYRLKYQYNLTPEQVAVTLAEQGGRCGICGAEDPGGHRIGKQSWPVDHNHVTKLNRGLLCSICNRAIGMLKEDPAILRAAADYLEMWAARHAPLLAVLAELDVVQ